MRWLTVFFSLYIVVLSCWYCADGAAVPTQGNEVVAATGHAHEDACSPFCTCNCCGVQAMAQIIVHDWTPKPLCGPISKTIASYFPDFYSEFTPGCWQPPKLSVA